MAQATAPEAPWARRWQPDASLRGHWSPQHARGHGSEKRAFEADLGMRVATIARESCAFEAGIGILNTKHSRSKPSSSKPPSSRKAIIGIIGIPAN